jgi:hypothetical protein
MYVTAQRVVAPQNTSRAGAEGVNAFFYLHGRSWSGPVPVDLLPEQNPGIATDSRIEVPPPGNSVRSYLDIVAPDGTPLRVLGEAIAAMPQPTRFPTSWQSGTVLCRFGVELGLAASWQHELHRLFSRIVLLAREQPEVA